MKHALTMVFTKNKLKDLIELKRQIEEIELAHVVEITENLTSEETTSKLDLKLSIDIEKYDQEYELEAFADRYKNKNRVEELYNQVFRPVIRYSSDNELIKTYETVWEKVAEYLGDE